MIDSRWRDVRRVLVIRLDNLGDVLVTTPAIRALRAALPEAEITLLASQVGAQAGRLNPDIDAVIEYQAPWMDPWHDLPLDPAREQATIRRLAEGRFDGAIIFTSFRQSPLPSAYLCYLANIPLRVAASIDGPGSLLTTRHKHPDRMMHEVERGLDLVGAIGIEPDDLRLRLVVPPAGRNEARSVLAGHGIDGTGPLVVVHPGCSMPARTYPWQQFADVAERLVEHVGATVVLTGVSGERALTEQVRGRIGAAARASVISLAGEVSFPALCALIETADLTITNNTGPMHVSAAAGTPVVALFALTNPPEQWGPWRAPHRLLNHDVSCRICYSRVCPYQHECLASVTPEEVVAAAGELLRERVGADRELAEATA